MDREEFEIDLSMFTSRGKALALASEGCPKDYSKIAQEYFEIRSDIFPESMVFFACISRARGLHEGIFNAILKNNPHATFPLIRAYAELITVIIYSLKKPNYLSRLSGIGLESGRGTVPFGQMFEEISDEAPGMASVYHQLSEYSHFRELAIYNVHKTDETNPFKFSWTDTPNWKSEKEFYIACAQLRELSIAGRTYLRRFNTELIPKA